MNKKTYFKKMLKNINNIYVYIGKNPIKIDRKNKKHRLLLTSNRKRMDEIIEKNNWSTTFLGWSLSENFTEKNDLYIGSINEPFIPSK